MKNLTLPTMEILMPHSSDMCGVAARCGRPARLAGAPRWMSGVIIAGLLAIGMGGPAQACSLGFNYTRSAQATWLLGVPRDETVVAGPGDIVHTASPTTTSIRSPIVKVERVGGYGAEAVRQRLREADFEAVVVPWGVKPSCDTEPGWESATFTTPGRPALFFGYLREREHWVEARPTFDVFWPRGLMDGESREYFELFTSLWNVLPQISRYEAERQGKDFIAATSGVRAWVVKHYGGDDGNRIVKEANSGLTNLAIDRLGVFGSASDGRIHAFLRAIAEDIAHSVPGCFHESTYPNPLPFAVRLGPFWRVPITVRERPWWRSTGLMQCETGDDAVDELRDPMTLDVVGRLNSAADCELRQLEELSAIPREQLTGLIAARPPGYWESRGAMECDDSIRDTVSGEVVARMELDGGNEGCRYLLHTTLRADLEAKLVAEALAARSPAAGSAAGLLLCKEQGRETLHDPATGELLLTLWTRDHASDRYGPACEFQGLSAVKEMLLLYDDVEDKRLALLTDRLAPGYWKGRRGIVLCRGQGPNRLFDPVADKLVAVAVGDQWSFELDLSQDAEDLARLATSGGFRDTLKDGSKGPVMVVIPAGELRQGD